MQLQGIVAGRRRTTVPSSGALLVVMGLILAVAVWFRFWKLGSLPGINGDEAWMGVQALRLLHGEPVAWFTPTGNPINPFYLGPLVLLHAVFPPSVVSLRLIAVASGLATIVVNFVLCRRVYDRATAALSSLLLAALPVMIAYSRFGWDASQSVLATTLVIYLALGAAVDPQRAMRWSFAGAFAYGVAIWVHPTNVFAGPLLAVPIWQAWRARRGPLVVWIDASVLRRSLPWVIGVGGVVMGLLLLPWLRFAATRLVAPYEALDFLRNYVRLLTGTTVYQFISGAVPVAPPDAGFDLGVLDLFGAAVIVAGVAGLVRSVYVQRVSSDRALLLGWALSLAAFYLVAGPFALTPHYERYGLVLVAPTVLVVTRGFVHWMPARGWPRLFVQAGFGVVAILLLASFQANYFRFFERTGGESHFAFRTAAVEPKQRALERVLRHRNPEQTLWIVADTWWTYWPLAYLATGQANVELTPWEPLPQVAARELPVGEQDFWLIGFVGTVREQEISSWLADCGSARLDAEFHDYAGRALLRVSHAERCGSRDGADQKLPERRESSGLPTPSQRPDG